MRCASGFWLLLFAALLAACAPVALPPAAASARARFEDVTRAYWRAVYAAHQAGTEYSGPPLFATAQIAQAARAAVPLPPAVRAAFDFYFANVEARDWGNVYLHFVDDPAGAPFWAVRTTTDGDDGWVELYSAGGARLGAGRTYIELVAWEPQSAARAQVTSGAFPPALADRARRTLWR